MAQTPTTETGPTFTRVLHPERDITFACDECAALVTMSNRALHHGWHVALINRLNAIGTLAAEANRWASMNRPIGGFHPPHREVVTPILPRIMKSIPPPDRDDPGKTEIICGVPGCTLPPSKRHLHQVEP